MSRSFSILVWSEGLFQSLEQLWRLKAVQDRIWTSIVMLFMASGFTIEIIQLGFLPGWESPFSPLYSIHLAFTAVLIVEVIELVFSLGKSFSISVGKQLEIFSLLLLRQAFEVLAEVDGLENLDTLTQALHHGVGTMLTEMTAAISIFILLGFYKGLYADRKTVSERDQLHFIRLKKVVALILLLVFAAFVILATARYLGGGVKFPLFQNFYLSLIYADILIILISYRFNNGYRLVFRNSAFAGCTLLLRLGLGAPALLAATLGVVAALLLVAIEASYQKTARV